MIKKVIVILFSFILLTSFTGSISNYIKHTSSTKNIEPLAVMTDIPDSSERIFDRMITNHSTTPTFDDLPSQFSWKDYNGDWTSPVKDQAYPVYCGSCYIFGTWAAFEAAINIASGFPDTDIDLSEQYGLSCVNSGCNGCGGGWGTIMVDNIMSNDSSGNGINGVPIESCMPYQAVDYIPCSDKCSDWDYFTDPVESDNILWQIEDWGWFSTSEQSPSDWDLIKSYLYNTGPLAVTIAWDSGIQNFVETHHDSDDVYEQDSSDSTNHIILLCGWVDDPDIHNGGYWILKNSHGTGQGYGGYCNIAYGCNRLGCSETIWITAREWPEQNQGPGPGDVDMHVFADFSFNPSYPKPNTPIEFFDESQGQVTLWEWDFDSDGIIDSHEKRPTWTFDQQGEYEISLTVWSSYGLNSTRTYTVGVYETWPPMAIIEPNEYAGNDATVFFEGRYSHDVDGGSIVEYLWDFDDGTTSTESHVTHTFSEIDTMYEVSLTVTDDDGTSSTRKIPVCIDVNKAPETRVVFAVQDNCGCREDDWFKDDVTAQLIAEDWTGISSLCYAIDDNDFEELTFYETNSVTHRVKIRNEGIHELKFYAVDVYGNKESVQTEEVKIDCTPPSSTISINGDQVNDEYIPPLEISISGGDDLSGVSSFIYRLDAFGSNAWEEYTAPMSMEEGGSHFFECITIDQAGNTIEESVQFTVDYPPKNPEISGPHNVKAKEENMFVICTQDLNQDDQIYYLVDWGDGETGDWIGPYDSLEEIEMSHTYDEKDSFDLRVKAKDEHGAESEWSSFSITVPYHKTNWIISWFIEEFPLFGQVLDQFLF